MSRQSSLCFSSSSCSYLSHCPIAGLGHPVDLTESPWVRRDNPKALSRKPVMVGQWLVSMCFSVLCTTQVWPSTVFLPYGHRDWFKKDLAKGELRKPLG